MACPHFCRPKLHSQKTGRPFPVHIQNGAFSPTFCFFAQRCPSFLMPVVSPKETVSIYFFDHITLISPLPPICPDQVYFARPLPRVSVAQHNQTERMMGSCRVGAGPHRQGTAPSGCGTWRRAGRWRSSRVTPVSLLPCWVLSTHVLSQPLPV